MKKNNNKLPIVSVLMSAFNSEKTLERAIDSVLNQSFKNIEFLICNDGSTDSTEKILEKYDNLYEIEPSEIPTDIQVMINNNEKGAALVRLAEVIGQDELDRIDEDTIYFIISTLNQLNIDVIRNKILLKVLPLKV